MSVAVIRFKQSLSVRVGHMMQALNARIVRLWVVLWLIVSAAAVPVLPAFAQTPVPLVVPTNEIFVQTNSWMAVFAPVVAIGVGIAIALAILGFIGDQILKAFR